MPSGSGQIFLGNLPSDCRVEDIEDFFRKYGKVRNVLIKNGKFGFCEFEDDRDADDAVYECNGKNLLGFRITVEHATGMRRDSDGRRGGGSRYGAPVRTKYRLKVENLSSRVNWRDLKDTFRRGGDVTFADAHTTRRNEGIVEFATADDLERVYKKYQGYEMDGKRIELIRDGDSRSRSRSRSRRSRSKSTRSKSGRSRSKSSRSRSRSAPSRRRRRSSGSKSRSPARRRGRSRSRSAKKNSRSRSRSRSRSPKRK